MTEPDYQAQLEAKDQLLAGASNANAELTDALYEAEYQLHNLTRVADEVVDAEGSEAVALALRKLVKQAGAAGAYQYKQYRP